MRSISVLNPCADPENVTDPTLIFSNLTEILIVLNVFEEEGGSGHMDLTSDHWSIKRQVL